MRRTAILIAVSALLLITLTGTAAAQDAAREFQQAEKDLEQGGQDAFQGIRDRASNTDREFEGWMVRTFPQLYDDHGLVQNTPRYTENYNPYDEPVP